MLSGVIGTLQLGYISLREVFSPKTFSRTQIQVFLNQIYFTGCQSLSLIFILAFILGNLIVFSFVQLLCSFVQFDLTLPFVRSFVIEELTPFLIGLLVIARSGTAVATEIGNMKVNQEILALESFGVSPIRYLLFPRIFSGILCVLALAFYFVILLFSFGSLSVLTLTNFSILSYLDLVLFSIETREIVFCFLKCGFSGLFIFTIACQEGLNVRSSLHEVPQAATHAVMRSLVVVIGINAVLTFISILLKESL
ncbi:MAG: ABC transporter permease [Pseudobdellovibrionaceae bacterium]